MKQDTFDNRQTPWRNHAHGVWFRLCAVCLSMYISYITYLANSRIFLGRMATGMSILCFAAVSVGVYGMLEPICRRLAEVRIRVRSHERNNVKVFVAAFGIALVILGCTFAACYPGGVNYDVSNQWRQAHTGEYNSWHPVFHTLLMKLITLVYDNYSFAVLVQIVAFAFCMARLTAVLHRNGVPGWLALTVHTVAVATLGVRNPVMYFGKDSAMTIGVLILTAQAVELLFTRGQWLKKPLHAVSMGTALAYTTLLRVNALFWTVPFLVCAFLAFRISRKQALAAAAVMIALMALVQGPLYGALDVVYPDNTVEESIGVPMTVLCDIKQVEPGRLTREANLFLLRLANRKVWDETYVLHNYNSIKFTFPREMIAEKTGGEILRMAAQSAWNAPRTAFKAVNGLTDLVWGVTGACEGYTPVTNSGHIEEARYGSAKLNALGEMFSNLIDLPLSWGPLKWLTQNIGAQQLLLLLVTLWALYRQGPKVLILAVPTLLYNLGTMCLLASNDARFFQYALAISMPCMLAMIFLPCEAKEEQSCR